MGLHQPPRFDCVLLCMHINYNVHVDYKGCGRRNGLIVDKEAPPLAQTALEAETGAGVDILQAPELVA